MLVGDEPNDGPYQIVCSVGPKLTHCLTELAYSGLCKQQHTINHILYFPHRAADGPRNLH